MTMVTTDPVAGVQAKLRRARSHLVELERGAAAYLDDTPFGVYTVADPTTGPVSYRVHVRAKPPEDLGLMLGDALHNARSALDHVACRLVEHAGGSITQGTAYPIASDAARFAVGVKAKLRGASAAAIDAVRATAAHPGGDDQLWALHQLDIGDKHKLLIPVGVFLGTVNLHYGIQGTELPPIGLVPDEITPIEEGVEVLHIAEQPRFAETDGHTREFSFNFDLALDSADLLGPRPLHAVPAATALIDHVETVALDLMKLITDK